jgi:LuxR family maltose regulon positive regulatory protein
LPLHRLLVSGQLTQVRAADLAFTVAEAAELLAEYDYRSRLSDDDLTRLQARTEGWAAGLRLAAVSMQHQPDPRRYVAELAGDDRSLAGYLVSEVLERQPAELRDFLVRTCVVDELSGELANALTGRDDGERTLARLEAANAFVMAVGSRREWYRYHPLFVELLRYELRRQTPAALPELRRRAAHWYARRGMPEATIQQAVAGRDWDHAAELLVERGLRLVLHGHVRQFRGLLERLPTDVARSHPELALLTAGERIASGDDAAEACLQLARKQERMVTDDQRPRFSLVLEACRLHRARRAGDLDEVLAAGRAALQTQAQLEGTTDPTDAAEDTLAMALSGLGAGELWTGELDAAEAHLRAGQAAALAAGLDDAQLDCQGHLALVSAIRRQLDRAIRTGTAAAELVAAHGRPPTAVTGALLALAWAHYQRDDLAIAGRHLQRAAEDGAPPGRPLLVASRIIDARLRHARGDPAGALRELNMARRDLSNWDPPRLLAGWLATTDAALHLAAGDTASARVLLEDLSTDAPGESRRVAVARLLLAEGDPEGASRSVSPLAGEQPPAHALDLGLRIEAWLLHALAGDALGRADQAAASLARAVELAQPQEHRRVFLDGGPASRELVARYRDWLDASWPFLDELAQASLDPAPTAVSPMPALIEPLSQREQAVLRYLPTMLTFMEIGSELYISVNTTKSHARSIYRKLGVVGRRDAVRRARQLQLLRS